MSVVEMKMKESELKKAIHLKGVMHKSIVHQKVRRCMYMYIHHHVSSFGRPLHNIMHVQQNTYIQCIPVSSCAQCIAGNSGWHKICRIYHERHLTGLKFAGFRALNTNDVTEYSDDGHMEAGWLWCNVVLAVYVHTLQF